MEIAKQHLASELTNEVSEIILGGIASGLPNKMAHELARVKERCFYNWITKGNRDLDDGKDTVYSIFVY